MIEGRSAYSSPARTEVARFENTLAIVGIASVSLASGHVYGRRGGVDWIQGDCPNRLCGLRLKNLLICQPAVGAHPDAAIGRTDEDTPARLFVGCDGGDTASRGESWPDQNPTEVALIPNQR